MGKAKQLVCLVAASIALAATIHVDAYAQLQGQLIAGTDNGTTRRNVKTDSAGRLEVVGAAAGGSIYGVDAVNTAPTQPPLMQACFGSASGPTAVTSGRVQYVWCDVNGRVNVNAAVTGSVSVTQSTSPWVVGQSTASNLNAAVIGNVASLATDSGFPIKIGGVYRTSVTPATNGQRVDWLMTAQGGGIVTIANNAGAETRVVVSGDNLSNENSLTTIGFNVAWDGTNWDRFRTIDATSDVAAGTGVVATANAPTNEAGQAVTQQRSTAVASSLVLCSAACNLYDFAATSGAVAGYILVFDATSAPADGAVTPAFCRAMSANSSTEVDYSVTPRRMTTGATLVYSSTGCFTKTASATAMLEGASKQ